MVELNQLIQLVTISKYETLSKAAEIIHISQPALTRSMQKLETEWNVTLFDRKKNKVSLNKTGKLAVNYAKRVLDDVDNMIRTVQDYDKRLFTISIGSVAPAPILELISNLSDSFTNMTISSKTDNEQNLIAKLKNGTYQIIITNSPITDSNILCKKFCTEELFLAIESSHHLASHKNGIYLKELAGETMLLIQDIGIWDDVIVSKMPKTKFIIQEKDENFSELIKASSLPAFVSNLTLKYKNRKTNRILLPILDLNAKITFYCCVLKENKKYLPK